MSPSEEPVAAEHDERIDMADQWHRQYAHMKDERDVREATIRNMAYRLRALADYHDEKGTGLPPEEMRALAQSLVPSP